MRWLKIASFARAVRRAVARGRQFIDDLHHSNEFKLEHFSKRSLFTRIVDGAANRIAKLL